MTHFFDPLPCGEASVVVIDPPWRFALRSAKGITKKGAAGHYKTMPWDEVAALPVMDLAAKNCLLLCWGTSPALPKQIACVEMWGFAFSTMLYWHKVGSRGGNIIGTGWRVRSMVDPIIVATRGEPRHLAFPGLIRGIRRKHSQKPKEFYKMVAARTTGLRLDLFSRETHRGFTAWGDEAGQLDDHLEEAA